MKLGRIAAATLLAGAAVVGLSGCYSAPVMPPLGWVFMDVTAPLDIDQSESAVGTKSGKASSMSILGLVAVGDCSIESAAQDGGITTIQGADYEFFHILGIYQSFTTVVHGE